MATGTYGTTGFANVNIDTDVDVWYHYRPSRTETDPSFTGFKRFTKPSEVLSKALHTEPQDRATTISSELAGMYTLNLPLTIFNQRGIYTIYIKPKEVITTITDADAVLSSYPDIRGIVLKKGNLPSGFDTIVENGNLVGYKVYYFDSNNNRSTYFRVVTSNNYVEMVNANLTEGNQKSIQYRFNDNSDLIFLTLSPSSSVSFKANAQPFIGSVGQTITLVNSNFNPECIEVEMVDYDDQDIMATLTGNQTRDDDKGLITTYGENGEIYNQVQIYKKKSSIGDTLVTVRENMGSNIDFSQNWGNITGE